MLQVIHNYFNAELFKKKKSSFVFRNPQKKSSDRDSLSL